MRSSVPGRCSLALVPQIHTEPFVATPPPSPAGEVIRPDIEDNEGQETSGK